MAMTLGQVRDKLRGRGEFYRVDPTEERAMADAIDAHLAQPAQEKCFCDRMYPDSDPGASCGDCPTRDYKAIQPAQAVDDGRWYVCGWCLLMVKLPKETPSLAPCQCSPGGWSLRPAKLPKGYQITRTIGNAQAEGWKVPEGCIPVPRSIVERWASVDAFNAPVGAAMELKTVAAQMLIHADMITAPPQPEE